MMKLLVYEVAQMVSMVYEVADGFFVCVCVYLHTSLYVSNQFNHCIKLFAPCGTLIGNNNSYSYSYNLFLLFFLESLGIKKNKTNAAAETIHNNLFM